MSKELIINQTHSESRVALIENGEILDLLVGRQGQGDQTKGSVGDVFLGRVVRVLPGMQSAFVNIGGERAAFLYVDDAYIPTLEEQRQMAEKVKTFEQEQSPGQLIPDELSTLSETIDFKYRTDLKIQDILKEGDEILVQIAKEPISTKGPRITRHITLAGRSLVYMPFIEHVGVSRRIEDDKERDRLREILESIRPEGVGVIARTVAEGQSYKTLKADFTLLVKTWKDIQRKLENLKAPSLVYQDLSFIQKSLRDITDEDVDAIVTDSRDVLKQIEKYILKFMPKLKSKIKLYQEDTPLFEYYNIDLEIERALSNRVFLKSGGSINIDQTEALVSIDVNTGKFVGKKTLEETILKTNLEAVKEISYQLRLRNCGGIIIIDFIDMENMSNRQQVYETLLEALKKDRAKTNVLPISGLGLVEMTRKRTRDTLTRVMCSPCAYCEGTGRVKSVETICYEILREAGKTAKKTSGKKISIFAHPEVCAQLSGDQFELLETIEEISGKSFLIRADNQYHIEQYEVVHSEV